MTTLILPTLLTHDQAVTCSQKLALDISAHDGEAVFVDASALEKFDSSALAVLLQCRRDTAASAKSFGISGMPNPLRELANLYGVSELLEGTRG